MVMYTSVIYIYWLINDCSALSLFTTSWLVSGLNGESTKIVFILHYRAGKTVDFDWPANQ